MNYIFELLNAATLASSPEVSSLPQFFQRYIHISKKCKEVREEQNDIKTQLRFGSDDIEMWIKERGSEEPYHKVELNEYMDVKLIPEFDFSKKWHAKTDKPPRKRCDYATNKKTLPSHGLDNSPPQPISRQESLPRKKPRVNNTEMEVSNHDDTL